MTGKSVTHKLWGSGEIAGFEGNYISVRFPYVGIKKFLFPDVFNGFLKTEDEALLAEIEKVKNEKAAKKTEGVTLKTVTTAVPGVTAPKLKAGKKSKPVERANVAFKCNYCDGGASSECIGFKGICSDKMIRYNIEEAKHVLCTVNSPCTQYMLRKINRKKLEEYFPCYESHVLTDWKTGAGVLQTGADKGRPLKLMKIQNHSLAVLTTRLPEAESDEERIIFAVFLVDESYEGDGWEEGYVTNNSKWRIELKPDEARQMLFWNYYWNRNKPEKMVFGSGLHRYLTDMQAAQILKDIAAVKTVPEEKAFATEFLECFCKSAGLDVNSIEPAEGALKR